MRRLNRSYFPENQLGASLKGDRRRDRHRDGADFPENQLGASLKAALGPDGGTALRDFPENQLGASLKATRRPQENHHAETSPRTNSGPH